MCKIKRTNSTPFRASITLVGVVLIAAIFLVAIAGVAKGEGASVPVEFSIVDYVNITFSNGSILIRADNLTYTYLVPQEPTTTTVVIPVEVTERRELLNITIEDMSNSSFTCESALLNQSFQFEMLVRQQLVPSQEQYAQLQLLRQNDSFSCQQGRNALSNEILNYRVQLNASEINYNATVTIMRSAYEEVLSDLKIWQIFGITLSVLFALMVAYVRRGWSPMFLWNAIVNQKFISTARFGGKRTSPSQPSPPSAPAGRVK